ncbi:MAG: serine hydrolase [Deltaproteobacteria bacterium]|nr:serine hydrolase [Deltaproteobacteria bacterium]
MKKVFLIGVLLCCVFTVSACGGSSSGGSSQAPEPANSFEGLFAYIDENETGVDGLLIIHKGETLVEKYYGTYARNTIHDLMSATKSLTSALIGIAINKGFIQSVDQPIFELLPEYSDLFTEEKKRITLRHLLEMSSGLEWRDWRTVENPDSSFDEINASSDSVAYILNQALLTEPGDVFFYNTGSSHLLSAILRFRTGTSTLEFAGEHLFEPLGITDYMWEDLPPGVHKGGWGLSLRPLDMAKFGELFLNKGRWEDVQLISRDWVEKSTSFKIEVKGDDDDYAFHWWRPGGYDTDIYAALGFAGQCIYVLNELDLVVVFTGRDGEAGYRMPDFLMKNHIVPKIRVAS